MPSRCLEGAYSHTRSGKLIRVGAGITIMRAETPKDQPTVERDVLQRTPIHPALQVLAASFS